MLRKLIATVLLVSIGILSLAADDFESWVRSLEAESKISNDSLFVLLKNRANFTEPDETDILLQAFNPVNDTLSAPFLYYIPPKYDVKTATPVFIFLHGGVSRPSFIDEYYEQMKESPFLEIAGKENLFMVFPMGNIHTTWWSESGIKNIEGQIRYLKEHYNIDDDRVYLSGFSDGGSGAYHISMIRPNDYAAFYPLNAHLLVGYGASSVPAYTTNIRNRFIRAVNTDLDRLYPAERMRQFVETALKMKANILYKEYWGIGHTYGYGLQDSPLMFEDISRRARDVLNPHIYWETVDPKWGRCNWLEITEVDTTKAKQAWHYHEQLTIPDESIAFGFVDDREYEGNGVKIGQVIPRTVSEEAGLKVGDVIVAMDSVEFETIEELLELRDKKRRGDDFSFDVIRENDGKVTLTGSFPPIAYNEYFNYPNNSGAVQGYYIGNHFKLESSQVRNFSILIHPEMVNLNLPLKISINGKEVFDEMIEIDRSFMIENFLKHKDRSALWVARIELEVTE